MEGNNYFYFTAVLFQFYAAVWSGSAKEVTPSKERFHQAAETSRSWAGSGRGGIQQHCCGHCPLCGSEYFDLFGMHLAANNRIVLR